MAEIKNNLNKLLFDSDITNYRIYKETGVAQSTLSDITKGKRSINTLKLDVALKLNDFYLKEFNHNR